MSLQVKAGQNAFLLRGGLYELPLATLREKGLLPEGYEYHHYPKMLYLSRGMQTFKRSTENTKGATIEWTEEREVFDEIKVHSEEEEERVLAGGRTSAQLEEERQGLLTRARSLGVPADPTWTSVRLRRELGDALDAPAPGDEMATLEAKLTQLQRMADMRAKIAELEAQLQGKPGDDVDALRAQLADLGVTVDKRWGAAKLREELDRATAPGQAA